MASKRMFSKRLTESARFLQMPLSTQALYFHLGLNADDDGIVEAYNVMQVIGCAQDDLKVLVSKGYVKVLNEDLVTYITDWRENNTIRADRKIDSLYQDLLVSMFPDVELLEKKQRSDVTPKIVDNTTSSVFLEDKHNGQSMDGIDKNRLDKNSLDKVSKHIYGEFKHVYLSDDDKQKLIDAFGESTTLEYIKELDEYIEQTGRKYKNHYLTIRKWINKALTQKINEKSSSRKSSFHNFNQRDNFDYEALEKKLTGGV